MANETLITAAGLEKLKEGLNRFVALPFRNVSKKRSR